MAFALPLHGVGNRADLPLPFAFVVVGASLVLLASFAALVFLWPTPRLRPDAGWRLPGTLARFLDSRALTGVAATLALLLTVITLAALVFGRDDANNPVPYVAYVWLWVGLAMLSLVFGPVWRRLNPVRWLHRGLTRLARLDPDEPLTDWWPGYWPAALGLFAFTWLELVAPQRTSQGVLRVVVSGFLALDLLGAMVLGRPWFRHGDLFEVWSRLYGALSPLGRRGGDRQFVLRTPLHGVDALGTDPARDRGLLATAAVMLGSTAYDGFSGQARWYAFVQSTDLPEVWMTLGLVGMCVLVAASLWLAAIVSSRLAGVSASGIALWFAPSLLPIAAGYLVAHYWSLFVLEGQRAWVLLSDPFGTGADWLGTADFRPNAALVDPQLVAVIQVGAIVLGHVLGVVLAHERAVRLFPRRVAVLGQLPLLVVMVGYTCGGLLLLFST
ncbi:MAG TPA: hypothetical protein VFJ97_06125 [Dermatophilaceae bacterium]|nr:hypothetical protein [Dermatophilaceae bacterium]